MLHEARDKMGQGIALDRDAHQRPELAECNDRPGGSDKSGHHGMGKKIGNESKL